CVATSRRPCPSSVDWCLPLLGASGRRSPSCTRAPAATAVPRCATRTATRPCTSCMARTATSYPPTRCWRSSSPEPAGPRA
ncbi:MAG: hypothetical protein AVDCRST_MAG32-929, partial [uncultured Nocardioides sp.]